MKTKEINVHSHGESDSALKEIFFLIICVKLIKKVEEIRREEIGEQKTELQYA